MLKAVLAVGTVIVSAVLVVLMVSGVLALIGTLGSIVYRKVAKENDSVALIISRLGNYFVSFCLISAAMLTSSLLLELSAQHVSVPVNYAIFVVCWFVLALLIPQLKSRQRFSPRAVVAPLLLTALGIAFDLAQYHYVKQSPIHYTAVQILTLYAFLAPNAKFPLFRWGYTKLPE